MTSSKEQEGCTAQNKSPSAHKHEFTLFLLLTCLIKIRELRLFGKHDSFVRVRLVVEFEGVDSVGEILRGLHLYLRIRRNPVKKFGAVARVFGVSSLIRLERFIMAHFFFLCSCVTPTGRPRKIIAAIKSRGIQHSSTNHNRDTCHASLQCNNFLYQRPFFNSLISNVGRDDFLVLEVLFERDAARHDGGELCVVHRTAAGVRGKILFHHLFCDPADAGGKASESCSFDGRFHKLVVRHGYAIYAKVQNKIKINQSPPHLSQCQLTALS